jgi:hypothetical protein
VGPISRPRFASVWLPIREATAAVVPEKRQRHGSRSQDGNQTDSNALFPVHSTIVTFRSKQLGGGIFTFQLQPRRARKSSNRHEMSTSFFVGRGSEVPSGK